MRVQIGRQDRADFFGRTGSGKTTLAKSLLFATNQRNVIFDPKHMIRIPKVPIYDNFHKRKDAQIIRDPGGLSWEQQLEFWNWQFRQVWDAGDTILYVDEATLVTPPRALIPEYSRCVKTGRERDVAVWTGSQRPKDIPSAIFTECEHFFVFRLQWDADRIKVASFTADRMFDACSALQLGGRKHKHDFVYYNVDDDRLIRRLPPKPIAEPAPETQPA